MTPERWQKVKELCHLALDQEPDERGAFLAELCQGDEELKGEVEAMIVQDTSGGGILDRPVWAKLDARGVAPFAAASGLAGSWRPQTIGRYRILRLLGEGGMGVVYEAEQDHPRRTVALKVIRPGLANTELLLRFERESHALGKLQHPGIAQIYEAGTADAGFGPQPYFAMEFIRGTTLRDYAAEHHLNTRQRLEVIAKICDAVEHAHQRGLIHRDLKPGNILVDETGQPKILDFGVARLTDSDAQATRQTDLGQLVGTLAYMSPEQVLADPLELDTRSDVYALGVILYELLAGRLPYQISNKLHEAVQTIREEDPTRLSSISRNYRGDIETIVAKALEKDKTRRYSSAAALAADLRRYLADEPITARPASTSYQLQKFARRHKGLVAGVTTVIAVLALGIVASTYEAVQAGQERDRAIRAQEAASLARDRAQAAERTATEERDRASRERNAAVAEKQRADTESATAKAVNDFLQNDLLAQASAFNQTRPGTKPDPDLKVRTALDRAAAGIAGKFDHQPLVEASIRQTMAATYQDLGLYPEAQRQTARALELRQGALGEEHPDTLRTMATMAELYRLQGMYAQAESLGIKTMEFQKRVMGEAHPDTLESTGSLGMVYKLEGKYAQAESLYTKVLEERRRVLGEDHPETQQSMNNLAVLYASEGKFTQAEPFYMRTLESLRRTLGEEHPNTLITMGNLASLFQRQEKYAQAEPAFIKALELQRRVLGEEHQQTLNTMIHLGAVSRQLGKYAQAEELISRALGIQRRVLGEEHPDTLNSMNTLARVYEEEGKFGQAEELISKAIDVRRRVLGEDHPDSLMAREILGETYLRQGDYSQAEGLLAKLLEARRRVLGPQHPETVNTLFLLGQVRFQKQEYADAATVLREALNGFEKANSRSWTRYYNQSLLGASLAGQEKYADAEPQLISGFEGMVQQDASISGVYRPELERAAERIVQFYQAWGKPDRAAEWSQKLQKTQSITSVSTKATAR